MTIQPITEKWVAVALLGATLLLLPACHHSAPPAPNRPASDYAVVGYGTQLKRNVTGAVSSVVVDRREMFYASRVEELIEGRFAGVEVFRGAGGEYSVRIRGVNTMMGNTEPLYVIDGVPVASWLASPLMGVNPRDVARIDVLKDAASTAVYGSRGANGVIMITTRRGGP